MGLLTTENSSIQPAIEAPKEFEVENSPAFSPTVILPEVYRVKSGKIVYPRYSKEAKALHWALERMGYAMNAGIISSDVLPGAFV